MFGKFFKFKAKKSLGVDIGTTSIRIVELSYSKKEKRLENYGQVGNLIFDKKPFRVFEGNTLSLSDKEIANAIKMICNEADIKTKEAIFSIPDFCTFFTTFELPVMSKEELDEAVKYEVRSYIPIPLAEITLNWTIIRGEISKTPVRVLVAAIFNEIIGQYQNIASFSGLSLNALEPEVFALARASVKGEDQNKIISLVDIGARSTTCSILQNNILKLSHSFNTAGNELTDVLAKSLNIDYNKAEEVKVKYGLDNLTANGFEGKENIKEIIYPLIDLIIEEAKKTFRDFYKSEGREVEKVILAGGIARMPGLKEYFALHLKKEIVIIEPFSGISYDPLLEKTLFEEGPSYSIAVGLALKGLE